MTTSDINDIICTVHQRDFYNSGVKFMRWNPDRFLVELILKSTCKKPEEFFANLLGEKIGVPSVFVAETTALENDNSKFALDHFKHVHTTKQFSSYDFNLVLYSKNIQGFNDMLLLMYDGNYLLTEKMKDESFYASWRISRETADLFCEVVANYNSGNTENYNTFMKKLIRPETFKTQWHRIISTEQLTNLLN